MLSVECSPLRFKAVLVGTKIAQMDNMGLTGQYLNEAYHGRPCRNILMPYLEAVAQKSAVVPELKRGGKSAAALTQVVMPLADGSRAISHIIVAFVGDPGLDTFHDAGLFEQVCEAEQVAAPRVWRDALHS